MIHWLSASKRNKMLLSQISFWQFITSNVFLPWNIRFYCAPLFPALRPIHVLPVPAFLLPLTPHLQSHCHFRLWYVSHKVIAFLSSCLSGRDPPWAALFCLQFPRVPTSLYLDRKCKAITLLPSLSRSRAVCLVQRTLLHVLSESSVSSSLIELLLFMFSSILCSDSLRIFFFFLLFFLYGSKSDESGENWLVICISVQIMEKLHSLFSFTFLIWFSETTLECFGFSHLKSARVLPCLLLCTLFNLMPSPGSPELSTR